MLERYGVGKSGVMIIAGIHGSEPTGAEIAARLVALLNQDPSAGARVPIAILAAANPDGLARKKRTNAHGVDLNRNFPARNWRASRAHGPKPASEPETRAIIAAVELTRPACVVSIHAITGSRQCNNYDGPGRDLAEVMSRYNGYRVAETIGYPTPGSLGSWCGHDLRIPTLTLELPRSASGDECWEQNREALLALIRSVGEKSPDPRPRPY
jgi:predicted deacylase